MHRMLIKINSLRKQYESATILKEALKGISLEIREGEIFGLLGVNGAGKTTLSKILAGLNPPTSGDVQYQNRSIYEDIIGYRRIVGFCPQKPNLDLALSLEENLQFAGHYYGMKSNDIRTQIASLMDRFNLHACAKSKVSTLSSGYKQRLLIARTLIHRPKFIILDEPTVDLDPQIRHQLWREILQLKQKGASVLLTTHYLDEAESLSDRVCIIDAGSLKIIDTPKNLLELHQKTKLEEVFLKLVQEESVYA